MARSRLRTTLPATGLVAAVVCAALAGSGSAPGAIPASPAAQRPTTAVAGPVATPAVGPVAARRSRSAVDTSSRDAVRRAYRRNLAPQVRDEPAVLPAGCEVAATPSGTQRRTIAAVNWARRMAGLDPVVLDPGLSRQATRAALIQHVLGYLTHAPLPGIRCFSDVGARASGQSNLAYGYEGAGTVLAYLADPGIGNRAVGHRRWLLAPTTEAMGTGQVGIFNALLVVPPARLTSERNASPRWIRWPTAGWFPAEVEPSGRWSFGTSRPGVNLGRATVRVTAGGRQLRLRRYHPHPGYGGQAALVWDLLDPPTVPGSGVRAVTVTVRGMTLRGRRLPAERYTVRLFRAG